MAEDGTSVAAFIRNRNGGFLVATNASGAWVATEPPLDPSPVLGITLALVGAAAHIAYLAGDPVEAWYATNEGGEWIAESVDSSVSGGWDLKASVAVSVDRTYVACYDDEPREVRLSSNDDAGWETDVLDAAGDSDSDTDTGRCRNIGGPSLTLDDQDSPHVAWVDGLSARLRYIRERAPDGIDWDCDGLDD